jgi:hypothetical protein
MQRGQPDCPARCGGTGRKIETTKNNIYGHLFAQDQASILKAMNQAVTRLYVQDDEPGQSDEQAA